MNAVTINQRLDYISLCIKELERALKMHEDKKVSEENRQIGFYAAEKKAEEIVECAIKVNQTLLIRDAERIAKSYQESFMELERLGLFSDKERKHLAQTALFRNRLAHDYMELSQADTLKQMKEILKLYPKYLQKIQGYLKKGYN